MCTVALMDTLALSGSESSARTSPRDVSRGGSNVFLVSERPLPELRRVGLRFDNGDTAELLRACIGVDQ